MQTIRATETVNAGQKAAIRLAATLGTRYAAIVSRTLGVPCAFLRYEEFITPKGVKTGATVPVFGVPVEVLEQAQMLGLRAEAVQR